LTKINNYVQDMAKVETEQIFIELNSPDWKIDGDFVGKDIVSVEQLSRRSVERVLDTADLIETMDPREVKQILENRSVAVLFYQPSTRTYMSFLLAGSRMGANTHGVHDMTYSSAYKGESIEDTIKTIEAMGFDAVCMRHPEDDSALVAAKAGGIPIISGGSGKLEHPTQALLDVRTIIKETNGKRPEDLHIAFVGDLKYGRTVHSLSKLMAQLGSPVQTFVSPDNLKMPKGLINRLESSGVWAYETTDLNEVLADADVIYMTRVQKEWFDNEDDYRRAEMAYRINQETMKVMKKDAVLMHPLPRVGEIDPSVDSDPRSAYFREVGNGVYTRMALLSLVIPNSYMS
jgi:aspartate carbamoyltransferase catalytic subunit